MKQGLRILIVDDFEPFRRELATYLLRMPLVAKVAQTGNLSDAEHLVEDFRPDMVLVDVRLGSGSGLDLTKKIRRKHNDVKVIVVSSFDLEEYQRSAAAAGALVFITKSRLFKDLPVAMAEVTERVDSWDRKRSHFDDPNDARCGTILIWHPLQAAAEVARLLMQVFGVDRERARSSHWQLIRALILIVCVQAAANLSWTMGNYMSTLISLHWGRPFV